jgi:Flp pilus assembly protein TadG
MTRLTTTASTTATLMRPERTHPRRGVGCGDDGQMMPMATILVVFLMVAGFALFSASQAWNTRRDVQSVAASAARAAAQPDPSLVRGGPVEVDAGEAAARANAVIAAAGYQGSVSVDGATVTVIVTGQVTYTFPAPGFADVVTGRATAVAADGVTR